METCQGWRSRNPRERRQSRVFEKKGKAQERERAKRPRGKVVKVRVKRRAKGKEGRGEVIVAINRTGIQPMDSSRVTFAREREERKRKGERERKATSTHRTLLG